VVFKAVPLGKVAWRSQVGRVGL